MKIGFYGTGNMGRAMIQGIVAAKLCAPADIYINDLNPAATADLSEEFDVTATDQKTIAATCDLIILAVKPGVVPQVLAANRDTLRADCLVVSIAAGVSLAALAEPLPAGRKIVRVMPNTPALVGAGMSALSFNEAVTDGDKEQVLQIFRSFGKAEVVPEGLMDAVTGVSGSSPAYVYLFIEALADGAVAEGMPRDLAYTFAAQSVLGAAKMVLETGEHPGVLKDRVTSPGGTTIEAVASLEENGFRAAACEAVRVATRKSAALGIKK